MLKNKYTSSQTENKIFTLKYQLHENNLYYTYTYL